MAKHLVSLQLSGPRSICASGSKFWQNSGCYPCAVMPKKVMKYHLKQNIPWPSPKRGKASVFKKLSAMKTLGMKKSSHKKVPCVRHGKKQRRTANIVSDGGSVFTRSFPSVAFVVSSGCSKRRSSQTCPTQHVQNVAMELWARHGTEKTAINGSTDAVCKHDLGGSV